MHRTPHAAFLLSLTLALTALAPSPALAQSDQQLVDRFDRADTERDHAEALEAALAILERHPASAVWNFNAGRAHAMLGHPDEAIAHLRAAADLGYTGIASFEQHQDLAPLRSRDDFTAILEQVRQNAAKRLEDFKRLALEHEPATHVPTNLSATLKPGEKPPLLIALHGTGGTGAEMLDALRAACDKLGIICIAPDALRPAGAGYAWTYRDESQWLVAHTATEAITKHDADPARVILLGFSQGANITLALATDNHEPFTALIPICGHYEPAATTQNATPPPTYLISGSRDPWHETFEHAQRDFAAAGAKVTGRVVPSMGHQMPRTPELLRALEWSIGPATP